MNWVSGFEGALGRELDDRSELEVTRGFELSEVESDYLRQIEGLSPERWSELSLDERLEALRELEHRLADIEGRPPVELRGECLGAGQCGYFDGREGIMVISEGLLQADSPLEAIDTVAHEGRHAFQHYAVAHPEVHDDPFEVAAWRDNFANYLTAELYGYEAYRYQPVEADAWAYGEMIRKVFVDV